ncbi:MAG: YbhB/YbcL family Raf kinase inhibitor-like protein [bacterium]
MKLTSSEFKNGGRLPDKCAYAKENLSPQLNWSEIPPGTSEFAIICDDPDAPSRTWVHWVFYGIPATATGLDLGIPKKPEPSVPIDSKQGKNDFRQFGYDGPHPPPGPQHRYFFKVFALKEPLKLAPGVNVDVLIKAMKGKIIEQAEIIGIYSR